MNQVFKRWTIFSLIYRHLFPLIFAFLLFLHIKHHLFLSAPNIQKLQQCLSAACWFFLLFLDFFLLGATFSFPSLSSLSSLDESSNLIVFFFFFFFGTNSTVALSSSSSSSQAFLLWSMYMGSSSSISDCKFSPPSDTETGGKLISSVALLLSSLPPSSFWCYATSCNKNYSGLDAAQKRKGRPKVYDKRCTL